MYNITIERDVSYAGYDDFITISPEEKSVLITHEPEGFMNLESESKTIELSPADFKPIADTFENINFYTILEESNILKGYDGWTLNCTFSKGMTKLTVSLWCPDEDPSKPETTKLLKACIKIFDLFGIDLFEDEETEE